MVDWWDDFARSLRRRGRSEATARIYGQSYTRFWHWALAEGLPPDPAAVSTAYVNRWVDSLRDGIAPATVSVYWRNLRPFFSWWAKETDQPNPFRGADVPAAPLEPPEVIHLDDIRALLDTCKGTDFAARRDNAIIRVLFDTGCRRGELVNLTVGDWDRRQDFLTLRGKTGMRVVPISPATGEAMARYVRAPRQPSRGRPHRRPMARPQRAAARLRGIPAARLPLQASGTPPHQPSRLPAHLQPRIPRPGRQRRRLDVPRRVEIHSHGAPLRRLSGRPASP